jgi:glycerophosphoryl diester phosphodiesterase
VGLGYRYLETDVHVTSDGVLVAFHDDRLDRVTDRAGIIADLPWSQVRLARVGGTEPVPLLSDILEEFPDARINIDPKHDAAVQPLVHVIRSLAAVDRVCIGSFSDVRIAQSRALLGPRLCTSLGPRSTARLAAASRGLGRPRYLAGAAQVPTTVRGRELVGRRFIDAAHRCGLQVHVWTIDEAAEMSRLLDLGVDGLMTDRAELLRDVLRSRGQWT